MVTTYSVKYKLKKVSDFLSDFSVGPHGGGFTFTLNKSS